MLECPICYNKISNQMFVSHCFHIFCLKCIKKALSIKKICPLCRKKLYYNPEPRTQNNNVIIIRRNYNQYIRLFMQNCSNGYRWMETYNESGEKISSVPLWIDSLIYIH